MNEPVCVPNPLLAPWKGLFGGVPPFDEVRVADFAPALEAAMVENLAQIDAIAADPAPPDFENTIVALERAGQTFRRVNAIYHVWSSTMNTGDFQAVERAMGPRLAVFFDAITQNAALFARIEAVYGAPDTAKLGPVERRLCWLYHTNFVRAGAKLGPAAKARVGAINESWPRCSRASVKNLLADEAEFVLYVEREEVLPACPPR